MQTSRQFLTDYQRAKLAEAMQEDGMQGKGKDFAHLHDKYAVELGITVETVKVYVYLLSSF